MRIYFLLSCDFKRNPKWSFLSVPRKVNESGLGFLELLNDLLSDANPMVVANAVAALTEINEQRPLIDVGFILLLQKFLF